MKKQITIEALITIILVTHNRPEKFENILKYYNNFGIKVLIGDSSERPYSKYINPKFEYYYLPTFKFHQKVSYLVELVTTPYVVFCSDDDFTLKKSIIKGIKFLEKNKNYSVVQGQTIFWKTNANLIFLNPNYYWVFQNDNYASNDIFERVCEGFKDTLTCFYGIRRTENVKKIYQLIQQHNISDDLNGEFTHYFYEYCAGYIKILPILHQIRSYEPRAEAGMSTLESLQAQEFKNLVFQQLLRYYDEKFIINQNMVDTIVNVAMRWGELEKNLKVKSIFKGTHEASDYLIVPFNSNKKIGLKLKFLEANYDWRNFKKHLLFLMDVKYSDRFLSKLKYLKSLIKNFKRVNSP